MQLITRMWVPVVVFVAGISSSAAASPIGVSGWNADVVTENATTPFAQAFDDPFPPGYYGADWFEAGLQGHGDGLPASGTFTSAATNTVVGGHTIFDLQPYAANNSLDLNPTTGNPGTLTLNTPGLFTSLSVLASAGNGTGSSLGRLVLNFGDGSSSGPINFDAFDWYQGTAGNPAAIAIGSLGRNQSVGNDGHQFTYQQQNPGFALYETDIDLAALGDSGKTLVSVSFTNPSSSGAYNIGVMGLSGTQAPAIPEPGTVLLVLTGLGCGIRGQIRSGKSRR